MITPTEDSPNMNGDSGNAGNVNETVQNVQTMPAASQPIPPPPAALRAPLLTNNFLSVPGTTLPQLSQSMTAGGPTTNSLFYGLILLYLSVCVFFVCD